MFKQSVFKFLAIIFLSLSVISYFYFNNQPLKKTGENKPVVKKLFTPTVIATPTLNIEPEIKNQKVLSLALITPTPNIPTQVNVQSANPPLSQYVNNVNISTPTPEDIIFLEINAPDGNIKSTLVYKNDSNPCSILNDAKNIGIIKSVTIMHYDAPLNSDYVKEINEFSDNWVFTIDGDKKSTGCSNYKLNKNTRVSWIYN